MDEFSKIIEIADSNLAQLPKEFKDKLHTHLVTGHTRYMVRFGVLGEGHDRITKAQRYYAAIREMWSRANAIELARSEAMIAQGDLLDAEEALDKAEKNSDWLRASGKVLQLKQRLTQLLVQIEETNRELDELNKVYQELKPEVEAKYPLGIEQAQEDMWKDYLRNKAMRGDHNLQNVPLDPIEKFKLGKELGRGECGIQIALSEPEAVGVIGQGSVDKFVQFVDERRKSLLLGGNNSGNEKGTTE